MHTYGRSRIDRDLAFVMACQLAKQWQPLDKVSALTPITQVLTSIWEVGEKLRALDLI